MDFSKFIKENDSPYYDTSLDQKLEKVEKLVKKRVVSPNFGTALMEFLIRNEVSEILRHNMKHIIHKHDMKDRWFFVDYSKKRTSYI